VTYNNFYGNLNKFIKIFYCDSKTFYLPENNEQRKKSVLSNSEKEPLLSENNKDSEVNFT